MPERSPLRRYAGAALVALVLFAAACNGNGDDTPPTSTVDPAFTPAPTTVGIPPQFPDDFPLPPDSELVTGFLPRVEDVEFLLGKVSQPGAATWTTGESQADVVAFYAGAFENAPYRIISNVEAGPSALIGFGRQGPPDLLGIVSIVETGDGSQITATVGEPDPASVTPVVTPGPSGTVQALPPRANLHASYPRDDVPLLDDAYIISSTEVPGDGTTTHLVRYLTQQTATAIANFYSTEMEDRGFERTQRSSTATDVVLAFTTGGDEPETLSVGAQASFQYGSYFLVEIAFGTE